MDSQVEQTPKCTPETLGDACEWISELPVRDLAVGKVPYVRLPAVARDHLADLLAGASSALSASLALPKVESETWQPIETAPKDGSVILAHWGLSLEGREVVMSVFWADGNWWDSCFDAGEDAVGIPSSWRSLPAPPSTLNTGGTHE